MWWATHSSNQKNMPIKYKLTNKHPIKRATYATNSYSLMHTAQLSVVKQEITQTGPPIAVVVKVSHG